MMVRRPDAVHQQIRHMLILTLLRDGHIHEGQYSRDYPKIQS